VVEPLRPARGGFLRPFGCGPFIKEFLLGHGPEGSPRIDPDRGAAIDDITYAYKSALLMAWSQYTQFSFPGAGMTYRVVYRLGYFWGGGRQ
jgi:hypothetical protein